MSGVSSFLARQKKADLSSLAGELGLSHDGLKKAELEAELENYLISNSSTHGDDPKFAGFYSKRRSEGSPVKKEALSLFNGVDGTAKPSRRRVTRAAEEIAATNDSEMEQATTRARSALVRTPAHRTFSNLAQNVPLPPSPAVVADIVERRTAAIRSQIAEKYEDLGITEYKETTREVFSSVISVQALIVLFELYNLRPEVLPNRYALTIPAIQFPNAGPWPISIPDLFLLLTTEFWGPVTLWAVTTFIIPLFASYFINLSSKPRSRSSHATHFNYTYDPLVFNIVKALLVFVVFGQDVTFGGLVDLEYVARINSAVYGGYKGVLTGTAIGVLVTLYDAIKK
ncbi:hypothetical protein BJ878DRAFT_196438 [Calycina marina]|uniref:Uncharacterized protein n=1 Tax=Calycina marina TaxID=1763456 RepID=A0A9P8CCG5_9HELO|nr:hypothetical protein BJ878DRAFT_196438 [Calycina marina]